MRYLAEYMLDKAQRFTMLDWAVIKCYLLSLGILLGSVFSKFFKKLRPLVWIITLAGTVYTVYRIFYCED